ncbi:MAG: hypothetical protein Q9207_004083 [Kuettlingeria erythrocarpa]
MALNIDPQVRQVFDKIANKIVRENVFFDEGTAVAKKAFEEEKKLNWFMKNLEYDDYVEYCGEMVMEELDRLEFDVRKATAQELWQKLLCHPFTNDAEYNEFCKFINFSQFPEVVELGKLYGQTRLRLIPGTRILDLWTDEEDPDLDKFNDKLEYADHGGAAVEYVKGPLFWGDSDRTSPPQGRLRRFHDAGYIFMYTGKRWVMTGHVMVIDLDSNPRQPWLILAKTWTDAEDEAETFTAPDRVAKDDTSALGVFPGNKNRTTIAKLVPYGPSSVSTAPLLLQFGPECHFGLLEGGKENLVQQGPALAKVMAWLKRPNGQEVCFDHNRNVYLSRDPRTGQYSDFERAPLADKSPNAPRLSAGHSQRSPRRRTQPSGSR